MNQEAKPLRLTQKDREVIEYFFSHFQPNGFTIHQPEKEIPPEEILTYREEGKTTFDFAKVAKDIQLRPVKVTMQFTKKDPSESKLVKKEDGREFKSYDMEIDQENTVYLSKWGQGYDWEIEASALFDAGDIKLPGFKEYLTERYLSQPTEGEDLLSEFTVHSLQQIIQVAGIFKNILDGFSLDKSIALLCSEDFKRIVAELQALRKAKKDRREFKPLVDKLENTQQD